MAVARRCDRRRRFFMRVVDAATPVHPSKAPWHVTIPLLGFRHIKIADCSRDSSSRSLSLIFNTFSSDSHARFSLQQQIHICPSHFTYTHTQSNPSTFHHHNGQAQQRRQLRLRDGPGSYFHRLQGGQQAGRQGQQCQHRHPPLGRQGRCR